MEKLKPLVELQNFGSSTHIIFCGINLSSVVYGVKYWIKKEKHSNHIKHRPMLRLDIDLVDFIEHIEKLSEEDADTALEILRSYFHDTALLNLWHSQLKKTPEESD